MKTVGQLMASPVITVAPGETVATAVVRLREHGIGALPVVDGGRLVGMVTIEDLLGHPPYRPVREVMSASVVTVDPSEPVTSAYAMMDAGGIGRLPVAEDGTLVGIITRADLLHELGKLTDPLTDLPWSGSLRQHGADLLKLGREIAVVFIDLDDFGIVNKLYGHVVGDNIIKAVAALLLEHTRPETDFLCRYGGDEFAIVTTRDIDSVEELATALRQAIVGITVPGAPSGAISGSIGIAGGKRVQERADMHHEATVDDLITMASRASTLAKRTEHHILQGSPATVASPAPVAGEPSRVIIRRIDLGATNARGTATVELEHDGQQATGRAEGPLLGMSGLRLLVEATLNAVRQFLAPGWDLALEEISRTPVGGAEALNILLVSGTTANEEHLLGSALFTADPHEAAVRATMKAINRMLYRHLGVPA
ncbi:MAG TPA: GGDEF domain-containing protein [bacterium]|nr:GGDEF domain-containing protein [bacterium]